MLPAWTSFKDEDFQPCAEHFSRAISRLSPQQVERIELFAEPLAGLIALHGLYNEALRRERELTEYSEQLIDGTQQRPPAAAPPQRPAGGVEPGKV